MTFCPFTKDECAKNCGLYEEKLDMCACLMTAKALVKIKQEAEVAASSLNNIGISIEDMNC